jgi:hypothetical protein
MRTAFASPTESGQGYVKSSEKKRKILFCRWIRDCLRDRLLRVHSYTAFIRRKLTIAFYKIVPRYNMPTIWQDTPLTITACNRLNSPSHRAYSLQGSHTISS